MPVERSGDLPTLSIIVPARNEEHQIERCLHSLLKQEYRDFEVIAVDDESSDDTPAILERVARTHRRLKVVRGCPLPSGWVGKPWALAQGARAACGSWLLFTDADTLHRPLAAASAVTYAIGRRISFLSLLPTQRFESPAERILLPSILWMIAFAVGSLDAINDPKRTGTAIFNGQYLLCKRTSYEALGGHEAVRDCIAEDYAFARFIKADGRFKLNLASASDLVCTRMYRSAGEIWRGFTKNLLIGLRENIPEAAAGVVMLAAISPLPEYLLWNALRSRSYGGAVLPAVCIGSTCAAAEFAMRRSRFPAGSGILFPAGAAVMLLILANSALAHATGKVQWRGRRYGGRTAGGPKPQAPYGRL